MPTNEQTIEDLTELVMELEDMKQKINSLAGQMRALQKYKTTLIRHIGQQRRQIAWKKDGSGRATPVPNFKGRSK